MRYQVVRILIRRMTGLSSPEDRPSESQMSSVGKYIQGEMFIWWVNCICDHFQCEQQSMSNQSNVFSIPDFLLLAALVTGREILLALS